MYRDFEEGKTYIFTKKKFIKQMGRKKYAYSRSWVNKCNGQVVKDGVIGVFGIQESWCIIKK